MKPERIWWSVPFTVLLVGMLLTACTASGGRMGRDRQEFGSNGERIYFTARSDSGSAISYDGGPDSGMMRSGQLACADCHGENGQGGRVTLMMETFDAPSITWPELTGDHTDQEEHPPYTAETVKQAIVVGINPAGERLDAIMPRWRMSADDLNDLVEYLQTLGEHPDSGLNSPSP